MTATARRSRRPASVLALAAALAAGACSRPAAPPPAGESPVPAAATPVHVAPVERATLEERVEASGHTVALVQQKIRAPFAGTLAELAVVDGDRVRAGETIGAVVARDSEAALAGAEQMARAAASDAERQDAARALELARAHRVSAPLVAADSGVVLSHAANRGDRVAEGDEIATIAAYRSVVFAADVAQSDLVRVRPGQRAAVDLAGVAGELAGTVRGILAAANPADLTAPVRIDLAARAPLTVGLFGSARILTGARRDVAVVPVEALLHDDVAGTTRLATVDAAGKLHWLEVTVGLAEGDRIEILTPALPAGGSVAVGGHLGLAEGAAVAVEP
ncbi:MAG: efflux RND transporter periplasmic adaptor subunit [Thermoanaerobaculia bacterium]